MEDDEFADLLAFTRCEPDSVLKSDIGRVVQHLIDWIEFRTTP